MFKNGKKGVVAIAALLLAAAALLAAYLLLRQKPAEGAKAIQLEVVLVDGSSETHALKTDALYLREVLEENGLVSGDESAFGLFVTTVDGVTADDGNQEWWCFTKDGEQLMTGVDDTPVADGDHFEATLTVGYDF
ncbi:MAG: DUF4430 domain-containing protein [Oscillospiraceae bacterium]|jgi:hypothetical protein|nr:DUF4430 domain-containing protein [Oscillospiraceae bacterium]